MERLIYKQMSASELLALENIALLLRLIRTTLMILQTSKSVVVSQVYGQVMSLMDTMANKKVKSA